MTTAGGVPLVAHVIHHLGTGGLENGLVNIINRTPPGRYRHAVVSLVGTSAFAGRITNPDVQIVSMQSGEGHSFALYARLWRVLKRLHPAVVHSRNLSALEAQIPAALLFGTKRVHGEHGRDMFDLHGRSRKYNLLRRAIRPLVQCYIPVSRDLAAWLEETVGVAPGRIHQIYNGVDQVLFSPRSGPRPQLAPAGFLPDDPLVIGTVGRLAAVKDQQTLIRAFARLLREHPGLERRARLVIVGCGPDRELIQRRVEQENIAPFTWLAGERSDIPDIMRLLDLFVLPSLGEGISNTILEAMATGLPVVATRVGGNPELVEPGRNGALVPPAEPAAMTRTLVAYTGEPDLMRRHGEEGRRRVEKTFNWDRCVAEYLAVYDRLLER